MKRYTTGFLEMDKIISKNISKPSSGVLITALGALISAGLFIQHTIVLGAWYTKTTLSDLILPFIVVTIAIKAKKGNPPVSEWGFKIIAILSFILLWMIVASINGYMVTGLWISWAWGTKLIGFCILIIYLCTSAVLSVDGLTKKVLLKTYVGTSYFVAIVSYARFLWEVNSASDIGSIAWRPIGFSENPNALAFILGSSLLIQFAASNEATIKSKWINITGCSFIMATIVLTGSRSTYLGLIITIPLIMIYRRCMKWRLFIVSIIIASMLLFNCTIDYSPFLKNIEGLAGITSIKKDNKIDWEPMGGKLEYAQRNPIVIDSGVAHRWQMTKIGLNIWSKNLIMGGGLGRFMVEYEKITGSNSALHTSIVWIGVEMGIIGLLGFAALVGMILKRAWSISKRHYAWEYRTTCLIIIYSLGASLGTEILYQRQIWFVIGLLICNDLLGPSGYRPIDESKITDSGAKI
jgi:O-antigen ligase